MQNRSVKIIQKQQIASTSYSQQGRPGLCKYASQFILITELDELVS